MGLRWFGVTMLSNRPAGAATLSVGPRRLVSLDIVRGLAVVLLLVDHVLATGWGVWGWGWAMDARYLTRPSLPLFMVVSGSLIESHWRTGVLRHQAWRVLPWAAVATVAAAYVTRFNIPEPLVVYMVALPVLWLFRGREWLGLSVCFLVVMCVVWPLASYNPAEMGGWLLLGVLLARHAAGWSGDVVAALSRKLGRCSAFIFGGLAGFGRRSIELYVGQLVVLAVICVGIGAPRGWS